MTCDEVRELLPEHLLRALDETTDAAIRRHLRGCAACREERMKLEDGVSALSRAVHDQEPPGELRGRVLRALDEEWEDPGPVPAASRPPTPSRRRSMWMAVAAAVAFVVVVASVTWGATQAHRASLASADAGSYRSLLGFLGGKEFRTGEIQPSEGSTMQGKVVLYDGDAAHGWSSWGLVMVKAPGYDGEAEVTLLGPDGDTYAWPPFHIRNGEGDAWIVTHEDLSTYDRLTITTPDGVVVASAAIHSA
ncbi:MAG TPA: zf-HC2 domain-containing protein [Actinomycetota bacterium]|nr:zf-HC2 domain-containing protein [Actinomycetota bacterium]